MIVAQVIFAGHYGGAEHVACGLTHALAAQARRSVLYLVLETRAGATACRALAERARQHPIELREFSTDRRVSLQLWHRLHEQFQRDEVDIVHCHSYKAAAFVGHRPHRGRTRPRSVFTLHGMELTRPLDHAYVQLLTVAGGLLCDAVVACSEPIARAYRAWPGIGSKLVLIRNAIGARATDPPGRRTARELLAQRFALPMDGTWVGCIARLVPVKNHQLLLRAFASVRQARHDVHLVLIGDGPLADELRAQASSLGLEDAVRFVGFASDVEIWYDALDAVILTSRSEGTPMVLLEAARAGLPAIASDVGGVSDIVAHGHTGLLFASDDVRALSACLARICVDPVDRERMGAAARERIGERFDTAAWAQRHMVLYNDLLTVSRDAAAPATRVAKRDSG